MAETIDKQKAQAINRLDAIKSRVKLHPWQILLSRYPDWKTQNTYGTKYANPEDRPGIYFFVGFERPTSEAGELLYIGSSTKIRTRRSSHNMTPIIKSEGFGYVQFYFRYTDNFKKEERALIQEFKPRMNGRIDG